MTKTACAERYGEGAVTWKRETVPGSGLRRRPKTRAPTIHVVKLNDDSGVVAYNLVVPGEHPRYRHMADTWAKIDG